MSRDTAALEKFVNKIIGDMGATATSALALLGDKLGLYKAMADGAAYSPALLATKTGTHERYIREWLAAQAAAGYVEYDSAAGTFHMTPEQVMVLAGEHGPAFMCGAFDVFAAMFYAEPKLREAFRNGEGVGWHEQHPCLFRGTERFFRTGYQAHLVKDWLPALDGVCEKLVAGATVADVGCGHGASTIVMAEAFPKSEFIGFDCHEASVERARVAAAEAGVQSRCRFEVADAKSFSGRFDLVCFFDCLHDMGDPVGVAQYIATTLRPDGTWLIVEPFAGDEMMDNLNPVGRIFYAASTMFCVPGSMSQEVGLALGAQAGEKRIRDVVKAGGFKRFRRAAQSPFNLVFEARQ